MPVMGAKSTTRGEDAARLAAELVRRDTAEGNEAILVELLQPRLEAAGLTVRTHELIPGRAGLVAFDSTPARLVFTGHLDTVPASSSHWSWDPWSGAVVDGLLRGRGATDMKGGVAAVVVAVESLVANDALPEGVGVVLTAGEETGCQGARAMAEADALTPLRRTDSPPDLVVAEPTDLVVRRGHRGVIWLDATAEGDAVTASAPQLGRNAIRSLAEGLTRLPTVDRSLDHPVFGPVTWNVATFRGGGRRRNVVPDHATVGFDVRTVPGVGADEVQARAREVFGADVAVAITLELAPVVTDEMDPLIQRAAALVGVPDGGLRLAVASFATDASVLAGALGGSPVLLLGPGLPERVHGIDEVCPLTHIRRAVDVYARLGGEPDGAGGV